MDSHELKTLALQAANDSSLAGGEPSTLEVPDYATVRLAVAYLGAFANSQGMPASSKPDGGDVRRTKVWAYEDGGDPLDARWTVMVEVGDEGCPVRLTAAGEDADQDDAEDRTYLCELCEELRAWDTPEGGDADSWPVSFTMPCPSDEEIGEEGQICRACAEALRKQIEAVGLKGAPLLDRDLDADGSYQCGLCGEERTVMDAGAERFQWFPSLLEIHKYDETADSKPYAQAHICRFCAVVLSGEGDDEGGGSGPVTD